jgi:DNA-binding transcriptional MerR regulator
VVDEGDARNLTIAQMAAATGVSAHTLRYYERTELIHPVARNSGRQRRYSTADVAWVKFLLRLRETGMPIAQMREYARLRARGAGTTEARLALLEAHQAALRAQIAQLRAHERALDTKIAIYRDDLTALSATEHQPTGRSR